MFDLGFSELLLIAVVALVVLGPERLPKLARMAGMWVGRIQNFISSVKDDLGQQAGISEFRAAREHLEQTVHQLREDVHRQIDGVRADVDGAALTDARDAQTDWPAPAHEAAAAPTRRHEDGFLDGGVSVLHVVSLQHQARQRKRACRPRQRPQPQLRVRRHASTK